MHLVGIHQELRAVLVHRKAEMIGHAFMHVQPFGPAESRGKVHAFRPVVDIGTQVGDGHFELLLE